MRLIDLQRGFGQWLRSGEAEQAGRLGGGAGFPVYLNNYRASLMASLSANFEQTERWLGSDAFAAAAARHIDSHPPHHWTLDAYGSSFPDSLQQAYPDDPEVADLARLEWAMAQAFIASDSEPLVVEAIAEIDWDKAVLRLVPSAALLSLSTNADELFTALMEEAGSPPDVRAVHGHVLIWRRAYAPQFRRVDEEEATILDRLAQGLPFAALCEELVEIHGAETGIAKAGALLALWASEGLVHCSTPA